MNETELQDFLRKAETLKPQQFERLFEVLQNHFRCNRTHYNLAIAWRLKQAYMLIKHQNNPTKPATTS